LIKIKNTVSENRERLVRTYNIHPDLGSIGHFLAENGIEKIDEFRVRPGIPLRSMLGERLRSVEDILEKMDGRAAFEYKYDGLRVQAHIINENGKFDIRLFSRQLEDISDQFPDVRKSIEKQFRGIDAIVEGECVPLDPEYGSFLPFQVISRRRGRKYDIVEKVEEIPVIFVIFDCLYRNGEDLTETPYLGRRDAIKDLFGSIDEEISMERGIALSRMELVEDPSTGWSFFEKALEDGCEGIMAKNPGDCSIYRAGSRGWLWIKYKQDYRTELSDTLDLVVVGAYHGTGRRKGTYGALLMAVFDQEEGKFRTICKLGSGFNDSHLADIVEIIDRIRGRREDVWKNVDSRMEPDVFANPEIVMEVLGAEITFSPIHTCSYGKIKKDSGLAIRFPRFTGRFRTDKGPYDATTDEEIRKMYNSQKKTMTSVSDDESS
jgi:DNA ligase-1